MDERVLSIQSHVASGYVGGKAAVFPLQLLGYDVDVVNTVNYSNHAGYGRTGGWKSTASDLFSIFDGMERNGLLNPSRLLTGYIPAAEALAAISKAIRRLRDRIPNLVYVLDPVMGDAGKLYVSEDVIPVYREILPLATIITPNYFEAERVDVLAPSSDQRTKQCFRLLTNIQIHSVDSLQEVLRVLHLEYKVPHVVISSIPLSGTFATSLPVWLCPGPGENGNESPSTDDLLCLTSSKIAEVPEAPSVVHTLRVPRIPGYFSGVGDLFSALVLAHFHRSRILADSSQTALSYAASRSCQTTHAVLSRTHLYSMSLPAEDRTISDEELDVKDPERKVRRMRGRELRLVKERDLILGKGLNMDGDGLEDMKEWVGFWCLRS